jgi:Uma2 family endonuclease
MSATDEVLTRHKLNVDDYHRMAEAEILRPEDRVELINGELIDMAPISLDHAATVNGLNEALVLATTGRAIVSIQNPVRLDRFNEPQPDVAVLRPRTDRYRSGEPPGPSDVLLLVEVAHTSLRFDRGYKLPLYAQMGIPEFWLVDLQRRVLEVYRRPAGDAYTEVATHESGDTVELALAPEFSINVAALFD